ncbi:MAG TPA: helix-turn-helix transcriptional regulator [Candidatus Cloacimonadota bacterium]|nr:helix-turn-helix transcriptional regulator [Candidatus Cloacimonadota bacterium]
MLDHNTGITNTIRKCRFDQGEMTQEQLAQKVGVTRQTIIALEAGKYLPSLLLAIRIARVFDKNVEEVFQIGT